MNLTSVRAGGGQQVASNFLIQLAENKGFGHNWTILTGAGTYLHKQAIQLGLTTETCDVGYIKRILFEKKKLNKLLQDYAIEIIYSYSPCFKGVSVPQVIRSVFSYLYFPEIDFWKGHSRSMRIRKKIIDRSRLQRTLIANGIVFENKAMMQRAQTLFHRDADDLIYIAPSITAFQEMPVEQISTKDEEHFNVLALASWHPNKNLHLIPDILVALRQMGISNASFTVSFAESDKGVQNFVEYCKAKGVYEHVNFAGTIAPKDVPEYYRQANAVILLSKLECFSSNIIEAWSFRRPLIIADEEWSRAICNDAALYVPRDNAEGIAAAIAGLIRQPETAAALREKGTAELKHYNSPREKVEKQIAFLCKIHEKYATR